MCIRDRDEGMKIIEDRKQLFGGLPDSKIFRNLRYNEYNNSKLQAWVDRAGINNKITPHCGRHTFAVVFIQNLYKKSGALMNLLGHKDISTTQRYIHKFLLN